MKRKYCCDASKGMYEDYYVSQAGNGIPVFQGARGQRGHGFGSVLGGLFRSAMPMLKRIGKQGLLTAASIASDVLGGKSFGESARMRVRDGINTFLPPNQDSEQTGGGRRRTHTRKRYKRKRNKRYRSGTITLSSRKRKRSTKRRKLAARRTKRRRVSDIFA